MILTINGIEIQIENFSQEDYNATRDVLEECLARPSQSCKNRDAIRIAFSKAVELAPAANPSDLWHHIINANKALKRSRSCL